jgi:hypothetical protein
MIVYNPVNYEYRRRINAYNTINKDRDGLKAPNQNE